MNRRSAMTRSLAGRCKQTCTILNGVDSSHANTLLFAQPTPVPPLQASFDFTTPFAGSGGATPLALASPEHTAVREVKEEEALPRDSGGAGNRTPVAIILEPARELAEQVSDCLTDFKVRTVCNLNRNVCVSTAFGCVWTIHHWYEYEHRCEHFLVR